MNCEIIKELISSYIDAELDRAEIIQVEKHTGKCEKCKKLLVDYQNISYSIRSISIPQPSEKVLKNIMLFPRRRRVYLMRRLTLATSFMVIMGLLMIPLLRTEKTIAEENPKEYYIVREEKTPYTEVYYEREGNFVLTSYSGGSF